MKIKDCLENGAGICRNEALIEELLAALKGVEWVDEAGDYSDEPLPVCPWCRRVEWNGHAPHCARQAAIAAAEEVP